jgi:hypothetical protein
MGTIKNIFEKKYITDKKEMFLIDQSKFYELLLVLLFSSIVMFTLDRLAIESLFLWP